MASTTKHNKAWTKDDITVLREMYRKRVVHREIAAKLKRTLVAVESKATELGLAKKRSKKK
ncbi:MAG: hypothetical protein HY868_04500 [Chloroflexi bacterium]|nr:hypothetical protein [Chloroflexota bacterium]